jgi:hypothetical protein
MVSISSCRVGGNAVSHHSRHRSIPNSIVTLVEYQKAETLDNEISVRHEHLLKYSGRSEEHAALPQTIVPMLLVTPPVGLLILSYQFLNNDR